VKSVEGVGKTWGSPLQARNIGFWTGYSQTDSFLSFKTFNPNPSQKIFLPLAVSNITSRPVQSIFVPSHPVLRRDGTGSDTPGKKHENTRRVRPDRFYGVTTVCESATAK
jgi:hypothetical protein